VSTQPKTLLTPEEYLGIEREAEYKSEYYDCVMYAREGARAPHDRIKSNVYGELGNAFRFRRCLGFTSDMRVGTVARHYTYPDASALCGEARFLDEREDTLLNPSLIVEVLSPSTEAYDRGRKFELYQSISSLREYPAGFGSRSCRSLRSPAEWSLAPRFGGSVGGRAGD
jgi:Uma2 family endonuclease